MDAPSLQGFLSFSVEQEKVADIHPAFRRVSASALMECAGWLLNKSASSKLTVHVRFDQPRSYLQPDRSLAEPHLMPNQVILFDF